jgi:hypothetical protein
MKIYPITKSGVLGHRRRTKIRRQMQHKNERRPGTAFTPGLVMGQI